MLEPEPRGALVLLVSADRVENKSRGGCGRIIFTLQVPTDGIAPDKPSGILGQLQIAPDRRAGCYREPTIVLELDVPINGVPWIKAACNGCSFDLDVSVHRVSGSLYLYGDAAITLDAAPNSRPPPLHCEKTTGLDFYITLDRRAAKGAEPSDDDVINSHSAQTGRTNRVVGHSVACQREPEHRRQDHQTD